jgi:hypothetical protein
MDLCSGIFYDLGKLLKLHYCVIMKITVDLAINFHLHHKKVGTKKYVLFIYFLQQVTTNKNYYST